MKYSGIGGQAVMEGVMMRNGKDYAVSVRTPDGDIKINKDKVKHDRTTVNKIPIIRGVVSFVDSLVLGISTLMISAAYYDDEESEDKSKKDKEPDTKLTQVEEVSDTEDKKDDEPKEGLNKGEIAITITVSAVIAIAVFLVLPYGLSKLLTNWIGNDYLLALIEGVVRILIFIGYVALISRMEDIKRVFMYHGAEHKCINCIEHGLDLNVDNVRESSRFHKRCGTSFLVIVLIISILVFMFIRFDNNLIQLLMRLALVPVIAGISYEFLRLAGRKDSKIVNVLSKPGLWV
ncbi:MAG: DUF1385 domain-containing protein, partial [Lachnospiraceae bacterium]|nr:DUF1385 domain-containing protein [Lachnospiraceae bacterium]